MDVRGQVEQILDDWVEGGDTNYSGPVVDEIFECFPKSADAIKDALQQVLLAHAREWDSCVRCEASGEAFIASTPEQFMEVVVKDILETLTFKDSK